MFHIIWPDDRLVTGDKILGWAADAVANGELEGPVPVVPAVAAQRLHEAGLITLAKGEPAPPLGYHDDDGIDYDAQDRRAYQEELNELRRREY